MKKKVEDIKINLSEALELPMDITLDLPKISLTGNREASIINHKGIIEYSDLMIRINSKIGIIKIIGYDLEIKNILMEEILVTGLIEKIEILS
ncbi:sporulation protein YqfC [Paratissierella segnis]|jgi:sporulation protein YqfC|uniref:Sporulation protein YqfC n=1 Tax=Paratissierella segnis TaxID=2763679 RepID=A0A926EXU2_9FIRM|nr:sporulation protein YqfC [Paratissierella segnis]MBC8588379.1 sporulation protein YqfC [Paratissierella segnis]